MSHIKLLPVALGMLFAGAAISPLAVAQDSMDSQQQPTQKWNEMDANGDGSVSMDEYNAYVSRMFTQADANSDGSIDKDEARSAMHKMHRSRDDMNSDKNPSKFTRMWNQVDTDGDGLISRSENTAHMKQMFMQADTNHDNQLSQSEWQNFGSMMKHNNNRNMKHPGY